MWQGSYKEGTVESGFANSRLFFTLRDGIEVSNGTRLAIYVDSGNLIKVSVVTAPHISSLPSIQANCGITRSTWSALNTTLVVRAKALGR